MLIFIPGDIVSVVEVGGWHLAIYFLNGAGDLERHSVRCVFCEADYADRRELNRHYFEVHAGAFSLEELSMAWVGRAQRAAQHGRPE